MIGAETALGFVFDPRYKDFPFAPLTMAVLPFWTLMALNRPQDGTRPIAEVGVRRRVRGLRALHRLQRRPGNWQSLWTCAIFVVLAITLWRARVAQSPE